MELQVREIDIIAHRRQLLVFIKVKARERLDDAAEAVTPRQCQHITAAPRAWLAATGAHGFRNIRFDVILRTPGKMPQHIPGAFET